MSRKSRVGICIRLFLFLLSSACPACFLPPRLLASLSPSCPFLLSNSGCNCNSRLATPKKHFGCFFLGSCLVCFCLRSSPLAHATWRGRHSLGHLHSSLSLGDQIGQIHCLCLSSSRCFPLTFAFPLPFFLLSPRVVLLEPLLCPETAFLIHPIFPLAQHLSSSRASTVSSLEQYIGPSGRVEDIQGENKLRGPPFFLHFPPPPPSSPSSSLLPLLQLVKFTFYTLQLPSKSNLIYEEGKKDAKTVTMKKSQGNNRNCIENNIYSSNCFFLCN